MLNKLVILGLLAACSTQKPESSMRDPSPGRDRALEQLPDAAARNPSPNTEEDLRGVSTTQNWVNATNGAAPTTSHETTAAPSGEQTQSFNPSISPYEKRTGTERPGTARKQP